MVYRKSLHNHSDVVYDVMMCNDVTDFVSISGTTQQRTVQRMAVGHYSSMMRAALLVKATVDWYILLRITHVFSTWTFRWICLKQTFILSFLPCTNKTQGIQTSQAMSISRPSIKSHHRLRALFSLTFSAPNQFQSCVAASAKSMTTTLTPAILTSSNVWTVQVPELNSKAAHRDERCQERSPIFLV